MIIFLNMENILIIFGFCNVFLNPIPFLGQVIRGVVGLKVDPLPGGQVQPVQICAVNVTCCPPKHVQEAIYNDHCLQRGKISSSDLTNLKLLRGEDEFLLPLF